MKHEGCKSLNPFVVGLVGAATDEGEVNTEVGREDIEDVGECDAVVVAVVVPRLGLLIGDAGRDIFLRIAL